MNYLKTSIGRLRLIAFLEGVSLLSLIFIGMPLKYIFDAPEFNATNGMIHGALFILFVIITLQYAVEQSWKLKTTRNVLIACFIPFGTFYIDRKVLKPLDQNKN